MPLRKVVIRGPYASYPNSVRDMMEKVRLLASADTVIRVRVDTSTVSVVVFTADWASTSRFMNRRRVFLETKVENDTHRLIFGDNTLQEDPPTKEYGPDQLEQLPKDLMSYLRSNVLPA